MDDLSAQSDALETGALVRAVSNLATIVVSGDERQTWLAGMLTADISKNKPGDALYSLCVNKSGRIQAEAWVVLCEDEILLAVRRDVVEPLLAHMDTYLIMEDAEVLASSTTYAWWLAHGPTASAVATVARDNGARVGVGALGELPTAVMAVAQPNPTFGDALGSASGAVLATPAGWERLRIQRMLPHFGIDFDVGNFPQEASLENLAVSFNKGCYIGQEAVFMLEKRGHVNKRLVRLVSNHGQLSVGDTISTADGKDVGAVTSAVVLDGSSYALGMVRYKHTVSGTELRIGDASAKVSCLSQREGD